MHLTDEDEKIEITPGKKMDILYKKDDLTDAIFFVDSYLELTCIVLALITLSLAYNLVIKTVELIRTRQLTYSEEED